jgi:hypothetical protein
MTSLIGSPLYEVGGQVTCGDPGSNYEMTAPLSGLAFAAPGACVIAALAGGMAFARREAARDREGAGRGPPGGAGSVGVVTALAGPRPTVLPCQRRHVEGPAVKRPALLALLLASSSVAAAPAPLPKAERPAARQPTILLGSSGVVVVVNFNANAQAPGAPLSLPALPTQPPSADPPG